METSRCGAGPQGDDCSAAFVGGGQGERGVEDALLYHGVCVAVGGYGDFYEKVVFGEGGGGFDLEEVGVGLVYSFFFFHFFCLIFIFIFIFIFSFFRFLLVGLKE